MFSARVLSSEMAHRMLTEERESSALGWMLGSAGGMFWHNGGTQGYRASMRMYSETGDGIVFLSNPDNGHDILPALMNAVARIGSGRSIPSARSPRSLQRSSSPANAALGAL